MPSLMQKFFPKRRESLTGSGGITTKTSSKDDKVSAMTTTIKARQHRRRSLMETGGGGSKMHHPTNDTSRRNQASTPSNRSPNAEEDEDEDEAAQVRALIEEQHNTRQVVIWVKSFCPYCDMARDLMQRQIYNGGMGLDVVVHDLSRAPQGHLVLQELQRMTQQRTVPQIFVNGTFVGGNSELLELYHADGLEPLLFPEFENTLKSNKEKHSAKNQQSSSSQQQEPLYRAVWKGTVLAESASPVILRGLSYYFPPDSVRKEYLRELKDKNYTTTCGWKGDASYWHIKVKDRGHLKRAAWTYKDPKEDARHIQNYISFDPSDVAILKGLELMRTSL